MHEVEIPQRKERKFIGETFELTAWENVKPLIEELVSREINNAQELEKWFEDRSELESFLSEDMAWRYINMSRDTASEERQKDYQFFVEQIQPHLSVFDDQLNKKALESPYLQEMNASGYPIMIRGMEKAVEIFREKNIELSTKIQTKQTEYQQITGDMTVEIDGEEMTLQKAGLKLKSTDREEREMAWKTISERRFEDKDRLDELFNELRNLRHEVAQNADFDNFRDYMFAAMERFDYTPQDCFDFHESVKKAVVPVLNEAAAERKEKLKLQSLRPWDSQVDAEGKAALKPFNGGEDLLDKTVKCFEKI
ncbi:MAG: M3 family metallopeptidase, partial [Spirosomaceae bacterium]|nr:M3 family metallopeptidase [Spirosomataceae bacterium]